MKTRMNKKAPLIAALAALGAVAIAPGAAEAEERKVDQWFAGSSVDSVDLSGVVTADTTADVKGSLGIASIRNLVQLGQPGAPSAERCAGFDYEIPIIAGSGVQTFRDHSQLYAVLTSGYVCGSEAGPQRGVSEFAIVGGTQRFEGANGAVTVEDDGMALSMPPGMSAHSGIMTGSINIPE